MKDSNRVGDGEMKEGQTRGQSWRGEYRSAPCGGGVPLGHEEAASGLQQLNHH